MRKYIIRVPYGYHDDMRQFTASTEIELFAKSEEHARGLAKQTVERIKPVTYTDSTEIIEVTDA